jgi:hypothetical protein
MARIQNQFLDALGDPNQDPADPVYQQRWTDAQEIADEQYRLMFGWQALSQMQVNRGLNIYTDIQMP